MAPKKQDHENGELNIAVEGIRPHHCRYDDCRQDQTSAHGRGAGFGLMIGWTIFPDFFPNLQGPKFFDAPGAHKKTEQQACQTGKDRPEGNVPENVEPGIIRMEKIYQFVNHRPLNLI